MKINAQDVLLIEVKTTMKLLDKRKELEHLDYLVSYILLILITSFFIILYYDPNIIPLTHERERIYFIIVLTIVLSFGAAATLYELIKKKWEGEKCSA